MDSSTGDSPTVCVVGSVNLDLVAACPRLPRPGETVTDATLNRYPGGKGANQALAARRQGADVTLIAAVGADPLADEALLLLREGGVDLSRLVVVDGPSTGVALIVVDDAGENQIAVAPGANRHLAPTSVDTAGFDAVLLQLEIADETVVEAAARATGLLCINAAPARPLPGRALKRADAVIVNEHERLLLDEQLSGHEGLVVVTRGAAGAEAFRGGRMVCRAASPPVEPVDTVGAGDAFCGTFTVGMAAGLDLEEALSLACRAGAVAATRVGAQPSLPYREELFGEQAPVSE